MHSAAAENPELFCAPKHDKTVKNLKVELCLTSASAAKEFGAGLAPAKTVTSGLVGWKFLSNGSQALTPN
jgi:hypothetical protein